MSIKPATTKNTKINGVNNGTRNSKNGKRKTEIGPVLFNGTVGTSGYVYTHTHVYTLNV